MRSEVSCNSATAGSPCRGIDLSDIGQISGLLDQMWWLGFVAGVVAAYLAAPLLLAFLRWIVGTMIRAHVRFTVVFEARGITEARIGFPGNAPPRGGIETCRSRLLHPVVQSIPA